MNLLSDKDADILRRHFVAGQEITLERRLGDHSVAASVLTAGPAWDQPMLVRIRVDAGNITMTQNFKTVDEAIERYRSTMRRKEHKYEHGGK